MKGQKGNQELKVASSSSPSSLLPLSLLSSSLSSLLGLLFRYNEHGDIEQVLSGNIIIIIIYKSLSSSLSSAEEKELLASSTSSDILHSSNTFWRMSDLDINKVKLTSSSSLSLLLLLSPLSTSGC
jgi:hypothetical protein